MSVDEEGRPEPPLQGDEPAILFGFLEFHRATLAWKCRGLDRAGLSATAAATSMSLGGLLKHMTYVEDVWFSRRLFGREPAPPWDTVDWAADPDWEWRTAAGDPPAELFAMWRAAVERSRADAAAALADGGLDRVAAVGSLHDPVPPNLRWIVVHMIEEYARHNGHADLLREAVDGATGE